MKLKAAATLSIAGATDLTPDFVAALGPVTDDYLDLRKFAPDYLMNLGEQYASAAHKPRVLLAYSARHPRDCRQAAQMAGLPNAELIPLDREQHNSMDPLIRNHRFMPLLDRLLATSGVSRRSHRRLGPRP